VQPAMRSMAPQRAIIRIRANLAFIPDFSPLRA
jgi:hypothetical protein